MACARVWSSHIELQAAASLFEVAASFPVYYLTIWASRVQVELLQTIPTKEINPPPQERPNSHIELCCTGGCRFDCVYSTIV